MKLDSRMFGTALVVAIIMIAGIGIVVAQLPSEDGLAITEEVYQNLLKAPTAETCRMEYNVKTVTVQDGKPFEALANIEYLASKERMHWVSDNYAIYQDTAVSVVVMKDEQSLFIAPSSSLQLRERQRKLMEGMRDSLFTHGRVIAWKKFDRADTTGYDRMLVLKPSNSVTNLTMVDTVRVYLNAKKKTLQKVQLSYLENTGVKSVEMEYGSVENIAKPEIFTRPIFDIFFDKSNQLLPEYAGYKVNDMRGMRPRFPKRME